MTVTFPSAPDPSQAPRDGGVEAFAHDLHEARALAAPATRRAVADLVRARADLLAGRLFETLRTDPAASRWISSRLVDAQLRTAVSRWLVHLFAADAPADDLALAQRQAGQVHGRCLVPVTALLRAARVLKRALVRELTSTGLGQADLFEATGYVEEMLALAVQAMSSVASADGRRLQRSDEAYRLSLIGHDLRTERERCVRDLLDWVQWCVDRRLRGDDAGPAGSEPAAFPLWLRHKAGLLFDSAPELVALREEVRRIAGLSAPGEHGGTDSARALRDAVGDIRQGTQLAQALIEALFDRYAVGPPGGETPGLLLHRRFFAPVAQREMQHARDFGSGLALVMLEMDWLEARAPVLAAPDADDVATRVGAVIAEHVRAGDFVFRIGGGAFVVLLVECAEDSVLAVAKGLARRITEQARTWPEPSADALTVCMGIAVHDGECDHQRLLDRADEALRAAQAAGPGQCRLAAMAAGPAEV